MSHNLESLGIDRLTVGERLELIEQIWDSLPRQVAGDDVPPQVLAELQRRYADAQQAPGVGRPFREVLNDLRNRT